MEVAKRGIQRGCWCFASSFIYCRNLVVRQGSSVELDKGFLLALLEDCFTVESRDSRNKWAKLKPPPDCASYMQVLFLNSLATPRPKSYSISLYSIASLWQSRYMQILGGHNKVSRASQ